MAAWTYIGIVSQRSATIVITSTVITPASRSVAMNVYNANVGGYVNDSRYYFFVQSTLSDDAGSLTAPSLSGYDFDGWYTFAADKGSGDSIHINQATVRISTSRSIGCQTVFGSARTYTSRTGVYYMVYPKWVARNPIVTFNPNGGYLAVAERTREVVSGSAVGTLPEPSRTGYTILGWFTASSGGTQISDATVITADRTFYAHWSKNDVYAMLDAEGGVCSPAILEVAVGGTYAALPTPTRPNYSFDGWFTAASGGVQVTNATTVTSTVDHTLYAHWTARSTPAQNGELIYDDATGRLIYDDRPVYEH